MDASRRSGLAWGALAYGMWGLFPFYFRPLRGVPAVELLAHRVVWSFGLVLLIVLARASTRAALWALLSTPRLRRGLILSALCITTNWGVYTLAVTTDRVLDASFGYFLNPLVSVALGVVVNRERLSPGMQLSVGLAVVGCTIAAVGQPLSLVIPLVLAGSFGVYGLVRQRLAVAPLPALAVETGVAFLPAAAWLLWLAREGEGVFGVGNTQLDLLLLMAGPVTTVPLLAFGAAAQRLPLSIIGLLQYIVPSMLFVLGVAVFGEPLNPYRLAAFVCIWTGLAVAGAWAARDARRDRQEA